MIEYAQNNFLPPEYIKQKIYEFLLEDNPNGDKTTTIVAAEKTSTNGSEFKIGDQNAEEVSFDDTAASLEAPDPWMQRKLQDADQSTSEGACAAVAEAKPEPEP